MVYLNYVTCLRYTILVWNPGYGDIQSTWISCRSNRNVIQQQAQCDRVLTSWSSNLQNPSCADHLGDRSNGLKYLTTPVPLHRAVTPIASVVRAFPLVHWSNKLWSRKITEVKWVNMYKRLTYYGLSSANEIQTHGYCTLTWFSVQTSLKYSFDLSYMLQAT